MVLVVKNSPAKAGDLGSIPGSGRSPRGGHGNPLQYSCLENPKDRGAWQATVHRVEKSGTRLKRLSSSSSIYAFPHGSVVKNLPATAGGIGLIPGSGRPPREGNGNPLQYSCLENPKHRGAWWTTVHGVVKSRTRLND